jgi:hypothetical protein
VSRAEKVHFDGEAAEKLENAYVGRVNASIEADIRVTHDLKLGLDPRTRDGVFHVMKQGRERWVGVGFVDANAHRTFAEFTQTLKQFDEGDPTPTANEARNGGEI